jgi:hypothetical protein
VCPDHLVLKAKKVIKENEENEEIRENGETKVSQGQRVSLDLLEQKEIMDRQVPEEILDLLEQKESPVLVTLIMIRKFYSIQNIIKFNINSINMSYYIATILVISLYFNDISLAYLNMIGIIIVADKMNGYTLNPHWNG